VNRLAARFAYSYFSLRPGMLAITIASVGIWFATGFNPPEGETFLIGIQWSTFATFSFFFYLLMVNFQVGGLDSPGQFWNEVKYDWSFLWHPKKKREEYRKGEAIDGVRAALAALLACVGCLFVFECIWVPLYDWFQFGSLTWPVYMAAGHLIFRNIAGGSLVILAPLVVYVFALRPDGLTFIYKPNWRVTKGWVAVLCLCFLSWIAWIFWPHSAVEVSSVIGPLAKTYSPSNCYVYPTQGLFPQNTYTFYACDLLGKTYQLPQILGFFDPDNWVHLVNVLTKAITFLAVCYPLMARVKRNV
jgi:hypothetical protein